MATKQTSTASQTASTDTLLSKLKENEIKQIADVGIRDLLLMLRLVALGILGAFVKPKTPELKLVGNQLNEVNITADDAVQLLTSGVALWAQLKDRDTKVAEASEATSALEESKADMHTQVQSYAGIIRSQLGPRAPALDAFGIKKLGAVNHGPRKSKKTTGDTSSETANSTTPASGTAASTPAK